MAAQYNTRCIILLFAVHVAASDVSTPMNSHDPATTQSAAVTDKVQPSPTCK